MLAAIAESDDHGDGEQMNLRVLHVFVLMIIMALRFLDDLFELLKFMLDF